MDTTNHFMRNSIIAILVLLCSCGTDSSQENESLKIKVAELERTIDSLRTEIALLKTLPPKTTTITKKKSNTKNTDNQTYEVTIQTPPKKYLTPVPQSFPIQDNVWRQQKKVQGAAGKRGLTGFVGSMVCKNTYCTIKYSSLFSHQPSNQNQPDGLF